MPKGGIRDILGRERIGCATRSWLIPAIVVLHSSVCHCAWRIGSRAIAPNHWDCKRLLLGCGRKDVSGWPVLPPRLGIMQTGPRQLERIATFRLRDYDADPESSRTAAFATAARR